MSSKETVRKETFGGEKRLYDIEVNDENTITIFFQRRV